MLDEDGLRTVLLLGPARPPESGVFRGISSLLPGSFAVLTPEGFRRTVYWRLEAHEHEDDLDATVQRTHDLITDAAQRQLAFCRAASTRPSCPPSPHALMRPETRRFTPGRSITAKTSGISSKIASSRPMTAILRR